MTDDFSNAVNERLKFIATEGLKDVADWLQLEILAKIAIPVEYTTGPRGGIIVIRSEPGEPPRYEFGTLSNSIVVGPVIEQSGTMLSISVETDYKVAAYLNEGTEDGRLAKRPFWPTDDEMEERAPEITSLLSARF